MHLDKADVTLLLIVVKCLSDILVAVNHVKSLRHSGKQRSLNPERQNNNAEYQVEQVILGGNSS